MVSKSKNCNLLAFISHNFSSLLLLTIVSSSSFSISSTREPNNVLEKKLSLKQAIQLALQNNHQLKALYYSVNAEQQNKGIAASQLLPKIGIEENFTRTDTPAYVFSNKLNQRRFSAADLAGAPATFNQPGYLNNFQTELFIEQPVFTPAAWIGLDIATQLSQAKNEEFQHAQEQIIYRVVSEFLNVLSNQQVVSSAINSVDDANEHLRISWLRYDANLGLYSDVLRASTAHKQAQQNLTAAQKDLALAKRSLGLALGTQESFDIEPEFPDINVAQPDFYTNAALSRKDIKAMQKTIEAAGKNVDMASAEYLPVMGLRATYRLDDHDNIFGNEGESWFGAIFVKWYLFEGAGRDARRLKARFELEQTKESLVELENNITFKVYQAWLTAEEAKKNVHLAQAALQSAQEGERLVRKRYENSLSPLVDLLDTQLMLDNARTNLIIKENQYRIALMTLFFESGTIKQHLNLE